MCQNGPFFSILSSTFPSLAHHLVLSPPFPMESCAISTIYPAYLSSYFLSPPLSFAFPASSSASLPCGTPIRIRNNLIPSSSPPSNPPSVMAPESIIIDPDEDRQASKLAKQWEQFFSDPSQWLDNRLDKQNPEAPDFRHKTLDMALWIDAPFSPSWLSKRLASLHLETLEQPSSSSPSSSAASKFNSDQTAEMRLRWEEFFSDPSQWWDCRSEKKNPRFPDFKHKISRQAVWLDNSFNPPWVQAKLGLMAQGQREGQCAPNTSGKVKLEMLWQQFFADPSKWWDNRLMKTSSKYPDFKHKITHEGLWLDGWLNPPWVKEKLATMASLQTESGSRVKPGTPELFGNHMIVSKFCQEGRLEEALHMLELMIEQNIRAPTNIYSSLLKLCAKNKSLAVGKHVHALIDRSGHGSDIIIGNNLVSMYAKCGSLSDAHKVFNALQERNVFSWTAIISANVDHGNGEAAIRLYQQMQQTGLVPDKVACVVILKACAMLGALEQGKELHSHIIKNSFESDVIVANTLVDMYAKCGCIDDAREVFNKTSKPDVISWNAIIAGYVQKGLNQEAFVLYEQMKQDLVKPDIVTYIVLLKACASTGALIQGKKLHSQIITEGLESDMVVKSALVDMYAKCGQVEEARRLFDNMEKRDVVSWNVMLAAYAQCGLGSEALALYEQMQQEGVQPSNVTYAALLNACASIGALEEGRRLHSHIRSAGLDSDTIVGSALVDMYAKSGSLEDASEVFNKMSERDVVTWNALIAGCAQQGLGKEALALFQKIQREGMEPNDSTYVSVLSACSHAGLVEEGRHVFDCLYNDPGVTPNVEHYGCMVDLLGRAGHLEEAEDLIKKMPVRPDAAIWTSLLGAAKTHGHVEIGRRAFDSLVMIEPENTGAYVLLSNIYAAAGRSEEIPR